MKDSSGTAAASAGHGVDTIAAFSTAVGGPIAVIRISGPSAVETVARLWHGGQPLTAPPVRTLRLGCIRRQETVLDGQALAVYLPGPHSYTGEDVVELHCHGGALSARLILLELIRGGARHAEPGEFTRRAFLNGKIDLTQAEAVADIIGAHSEAALRLANRQLGGLLGRRIDALYSTVLDLLSEVEARLDFPDENLDWLSADEVACRLRDAEADLAGLLARRREGEILRQGILLVIAGPTNVGKSSLMNAILGQDRAIVTSIPGTTRDTLEEMAHIRGIPVRLVDTAGLRDAQDIVEKLGIERTFATLAKAHVVLWVFDASLSFAVQAPPRLPGATILLVGNKADTGKAAPDDLPRDLPSPVYTCALTGVGLDLLFDAIELAVWKTPRFEEPEVAVSARHAALLDAALAALGDARDRLHADQWELAAEALRSSLTAVGQVSGRTVSPDVLDTIFAKFCVGK